MKIERREIEKDPSRTWRGRQKRSRRVPMWGMAGGKKAANHFVVRAKRLLLFPLVLKKSPSG